jgi:hypothetical protein
MGSLQSVSQVTSPSFSREFETMSKKLTSADKDKLICDAANESRLAVALAALKSEQGNKYWKPYVQVEAHADRHTETYTVIMPGGRFFVEIPRHATNVVARTSGAYMYHSDVLTPAQARHRFLRAYFGSQFESGHLSRAQYSELSLRLEQAAGRLFQS